MAFDPDRGNGPAQFNAEDWLREQLGDAHQLSGTDQPVIKKRKKQSYASILMVGVLALAFGGVVLFTQKPGGSQKATQNDSDDLGQGIVNASGLRGHLVTRWLNGKAQYQLKIEPIDNTANAGFALVTGNPPGPIVINIRVLDSSGFALCGKEILVRFDPTRAMQTNAALPKGPADAEQALAMQQLQLQNVRAEEKSREEGQDVFQDIAGKDGQVEALWAQGTLPCSPDQYRKFDYWDMTTNFPTLPEQQGLLARRAGPPKKTEAEERADARRKAAAAAARKPTSAFYVEGDDQISGYEPGRTLLTAGPGRSFFIDRKSDQAIVAEWAADTALIHYKCDQHGWCALRHAGSGTTVLGRMNE